MIVAGGVTPPPFAGEKKKKPPPSVSTSQARRRSVTRRRPRAKKRVPAVSFADVDLKTDLSPTLKGGVHPAARTGGPAKRVQDLGYNRLGKLDKNASRPTKQGEERRPPTDQGGGVGTPLPAEIHYPSYHF